MISVALCTYNGVGFVEKQIQSILEQTMPVDEIVVCDDGSTDGTLQIIERLQKNASVEIRVYCNETNLGVGANFQKAVGLCRGDVVFLSDQDDVWFPHKVKAIMEWFNVHPDKSVVFSDAVLIDSEGKPLVCNKGQCHLWDYYFVPSERRKFEKGLVLECMMKPHATGATLAAKKAFLDDHPFSQVCDNVQVFHDLFIAVRAAEAGLLGFIDDTLVGYRIHDAQQVGVGSLETVDNTKEDWRSPFYSEDFIVKLLQEPFSKERIDFMKWRIWTKHRLYGPMIVVWNWRRYRKYYRKLCLSMMAFDAKASVTHSFSRLRKKLIGSHP